MAALLAPSFPAGFAAPAGQVVGAFKAAGFDYVVEVAHGADLVSVAYKEYLEAHPTGLHIATACPAVAEYVRKYHPDLTDALVPIVSPMIATALAVKELYGADVRCVFVGPCVAKKAEARDEELQGVIDEVLTLQEAHRLLAERGVDLAAAPAAAWDEPAAGGARVFPLPGGLLESAGLDRGILDPDVLVVSGHGETVEVLDSLGTADTGRTLLVEALMCNGCYCGPGISSEEPGLLRKRRVGEYVAESQARQRAEAPAADAAGFAALPLTRTYSSDDQRDAAPSEDEIRDILAHTNKFFPEDELNCGACGYATCRAKAIAVHSGMAEEAMCLPFMIEQAERVCDELNVPWSDLRDVHRHIINTEKLASMGQMAAGVAHELNNPLSTILLYTHILGKKLADRDDLDHDLKLVAEESERCKKIVGNLLDFARQSRVHMQTVDVEDLVRKAVDGAACTLEPGNGSRGAPRGRRHPRPARRPRPRPDHAGPGQPGQERRGGHGRPLGRRARERLRDARAAPPAHRRERRGRRHPAERPRQGLPAVLHDQEHRQGHRPGPADQLRHRQDAPGHDLVRLRSGAGHDLPHRAAHDPRHPRKEHDG